MLAAASSRFSGAESAPTIAGTNESVLVKGAGYSWEYTQTDDTFRLSDARNRLMVSGKTPAPGGGGAGR